MEALIIASKAISLEENDEKNKFMIMCREQHAGRCHNIEKGDKSL